MTENELASVVLNISFSLHKQYGIGMLESVYEKLLCFELRQLNISTERQKSINLVHKGQDMGVAFRADVVVENKLIIELKSVSVLGNEHYLQLLTYLKVSNIKLGLLINFNAVLLKNGIKRIANKL